MLPLGSHLRLESCQVLYLTFVQVDLGLSELLQRAAVISIWLTGLEHLIQTAHEIAPNESSKVLPT
jgi:hypothetical protein